MCELLNQNPVNLSKSGLRKQRKWHGLTGLPLELDDNYKTLLPAVGILTNIKKASHASQHTLD